MTQPTPIQAMTVSCEPCGHRWVAAYLPMPVDTWVKILRAARCPMCGNGPEKIFVHQV